MSEWFYRGILALYPKRFRKEYGPAALELFRERERAESGFFARSQLWFDLLRDAAVSIPREHWRREPTAGVMPVADVPLFFTFKNAWPQGTALLNGAILSIGVFAAATFAVQHSNYHGVWWIGSHHASPPRILVSAESLDARVGLPAFWFERRMPDYFRFIQVLGSLDVDRDGVISEAEMVDAPAALWALDTNGDGELTPEECGFRHAAGDPQILNRARAVFMTLHPALRAIDSDHDGKISAREIWCAASALRTLDRNGDHRLTEAELLPDPDLARVAQLMLTLDANGDGKLSTQERSATPDLSLRTFLDQADVDRDGFVTAGELTDALAVWSEPSSRVRLDRLLTPLAKAINIEYIEARAAEMPRVAEGRLRQR